MTDKETWDAIKEIAAHANRINTIMKELKENKQEVMIATEYQEHPNQCIAVEVDIYPKLQTRIQVSKIPEFVQAQRFSHTELNDEMTVNLDGATVFALVNRE